MASQGVQHRSRGIILVVVCVIALIIVGLASKPILLHVHVFSSSEDRACGEYNKDGTGITIFNPLRSRAVELTSDEFLRAAAEGACSPGLDAAVCTLIKEHQPIPLSGRELANRYDAATSTKLLYRLSGSSKDIQDHGGCAIAEVDLKRDGESWRVTGFGVTYGPSTAR